MIGVTSSPCHSDPRRHKSSQIVLKDDVSLLLSVTSALIDHMSYRKKSKSTTELLEAVSERKSSVLLIQAQLLIIFHRNNAKVGKEGTKNLKPPSVCNKSLVYNSQQSEAKVGTRGWLKLDGLRF